MIYLYSGTPGSGKSYHAVADIYYRTKKKKGFTKVLANFPVNCGAAQKNFTYIDNSDMTVKNLIKYSAQNHVSGLEGQTLVVIDEAQIIFNSRSWNSDSKKNDAESSRMDWIKFFSQHRKLGFNFIMIAQFDRMLDRQIRCLIEYEVAHMKINNYFRILPLTVFMAVERWYGQKMKIGHDVILYRKKIAALYDTYAMFDANAALVPGVVGPGETVQPLHHKGKYRVKSRASRKRAYHYRVINLFNEHITVLDQKLQHEEMCSLYKINWCPS